MYRATVVWADRFARRVLRRLALRGGLRDPASAYDLWSTTYDSEKQNLLVLLDEAMFQELLARVRIDGKAVVDVGCGTGRHWDRILALRPATLVGYDASAGMLAQLRRKYPQATVHLSSAHNLSSTADHSCDLVVSTLALSHFPSADQALREWARVLRGGGDVLVTDFHPAAAATSETTFLHRERVVSVRKYVHSLATIERAATQSGLQLVALKETAIDESVKRHYDRAGMHDVFERMRGLPLLYGMHLSK